MSLRGMLVQRATVLRLDAVAVDGVANYDWAPFATGVPCRLDLSYMRKGKDQGWVAEAGRPVDRAGVLFLQIIQEDILRPGDRVEVFNRLGRKIGTFEVNGAFDTVDDRHGIPHHIEAGVTEVANALAEGAAYGPVSPGTVEP